MTAVQPFDFDGQQVRVVADEQGEPLFVAADVAAILGYSETAAMTRRLDGDDVSNLRISQVAGGRPWTKPDGTSHVSRSTRVTAKGLDWLAARYGDGGTQYELQAVGW